MQLLKTWFAPLALSLLASAIALPACAEIWRASVNTAADVVQPDAGLSLREAILLANGDRPLAALSPAERARLAPADRPTIAFDLPPDQTTIRLQSELPAIARPDLLLDATTQPALASEPEVAPQLRPPRVALTPDRDRQVPRGLTITADRVTVRGFSFYGFQGDRRATGLLPANILISHPLPPPDANQQYIPAQHLPYLPTNQPPQEVVIERNWLGLPPSGEPPERRSAFGVYVLNGDRLQIRLNRIAYQSASAVATSFRAPGLAIVENLIEANGFAGMPDALRLEGDLSGAEIRANAIRGNAGSAIYAFKPTGRVAIADNEIADNGQSWQRAAIYLMGSGHRVEDNWLRSQPGPGVAIAAQPAAEGVQVVGNQFANLAGLSIDLVTQLNADIQTYERGDGRNPPVSHHHHRRQTANYGVNAPRFASREFVRLPSGRVTLLGAAAPGTQVAIYQTDASGALHRLLANVTAAATGQFAATLDGLEPGARLSAIATHPEHGTSEPALPATIRAVVGVE